MIAYIRNSFFLLFFLLSGLQASAQNPVQVNVFLTPPYAVKLSDYTAPGTSKLQAQLLLRDLTVPERQVRLRLVLSNGSATLSTRASFRPMPLYLQGGLPLFLTGDDLAPYLDPNNLDFGGSLTRQQYQRLGTLPEGFWTFNIQVIDYQRGNVISNTGTATAWLMYNEPPLLNLPANKSTARILDPQNIVFQWTPRHTASPNAVGNVEYEFTLVEIYPSGREPNNAMQAANPIYQTTTRQTTLVYGIAETPLTLGREYAWKVRAIDGSGLDLFRNQGNSEVWMFQYGETCSTPTGLTATTNQSNRIDLNWNQSEAHSSYTIQYRPQGWNKWYSTTSPINKLTLTNLDPETTYEIQVAATCGPFTSDLTDPRRVTTPERYEAEYTCGQPLPSIDKSNRNPATDLAIGSLIYAADFDVQLTSVWEQEGKFSGTGYTAVPLFNNARVNVTFQNVLINTDHRLVEGYLKVVNGTVQILNDDQLEQLAELREELNATLNTIDQNLNQLETLAGYLDDFLTGLSALDDPPDLFTAEERAYIESMNDEEKIAYAQTLIEEGSALLESDNARDRERGEKKLRQARAILNEAGQQEGNALIATRIDWANGANASHGFDATGAEAVQRWYEQIPIGDGLYQIPWKAVKTGQPEEVQATLQSETEGLSLADLQFTLEGRTLSIQQDQSAPTEGRLSVLSTVTEQKQQLKATHPQEGEEEQLLGILNVIAYDGLQKRLVLVPVNNNDAGLSQTAVQNTLNDIYGQAAVNWTVRVEESFAYPYESFNTGESGLLSNYSADMRALIRQYKQEKGSTIDEDSYYLFLLPEGGIQGYMPRAKQFGFLFTQGQGSEELTTTIAHELGHGAFHLQHIFTEYGTPEGSTDNLMDYAGGTRLHKYQWDHIHHPQTVIGFLEEDEAGALDVVTVAPREGYAVDEETGYATFVAPSGKPFSCKPEGAVDIIVSSEPFSIEAFDNEEGSQMVNDLQLSVGVLMGFTQDQQHYSVRFSSGGTFLGYYRDSDNAPLYDNHSLTFEEPNPYPVNVIDATGAFTQIRWYYYLSSDWEEDEYLAAGEIAYPFDTDVYTTLARSISSEQYEQKVTAFAERLKAQWASKTYLQKEDRFTLSVNGEFHFEDLNDRFSVFHQETGDVLLVDIVYLPGKPDEEQLNGLARRVVEAAGLDEEEKLLYLLLPVWEETDITTELRFVDKNRFGKTFYAKGADYSNIPALLEYRRASGSIHDQIKAVYRQIPKPLYEYYHFYRVDGVHIKPEKPVYTERISGREHIYHLEFYYDENIDARLQLESILAENEKYLSFEQADPASGITESRIEQGRKTYYQAEQNLKEWYATLDERLLNPNFTNTSVFLSQSYFVEHILRESSIPQYEEEFVFNYIQYKFEGYFLGQRYYKDIPESAFFDADYGDIIYGVIDVAGLILSLFDLDVLADGAGAFYAYYRGDYEELVLYQAAVALPVVSAPLLRVITKSGKEVIVFGKKTYQLIRKFLRLSDDAIELTGDISTRLVRAESKSGTQYLDVVIHGDGNKFVIDGQSYSGTDLAEIIRAHNPNNQPIRLLSCSNLESAQEIARHLNTEVIANNGITRLHADGGITAVSKADGTPEPWQRIGPDGNVKDADINFNSQTTQPDEYISLGKKVGDEIGGSFKSIDEIVASVEPEYQAALRTFLESSEEAAEAFGRNPGLVDGWDIARRAGLEDAIRLNPTDLEKISNYKSLSGKSADYIVQEIESSAITAKGSTRSWIDIVSTGGGNKVGQIGDYAVYENVEVFYRGVSASDYQHLLNTGQLRATSETFTSPSLEYIKAIGYGGDGHVLKFYVDKGTLKALEGIGVRNDGATKLMGYYPDMPHVTTVTKWTENNAMFKTEGSALGMEQVNIGLGKGTALEIFNSNLKAFEVVQ